VFVAAGGRAVPLGVSRQFIGEPAFGAAGYRYCGNVLAAPKAAAFGDDTSVVDAACAVAQTAAAEFGLVGVNGIDFVARNGTPWVVEINPRWCASMELVELAYGLSMFDLHVAACATGTLPDFDFATARRAGVAHGKAVIFARHAVTIGNTREWLSQNQDQAHARFRDIPRPGERISAGRPVCTVFATGRDASACQGELTERAARVYAQLAAWERTSSVL
jgi:predicted ATP-grasp superfamily ATP-dependent carboligase